MAGSLKSRLRKSFKLNRGPSTKPSASSIHGEERISTPKATSLRSITSRISRGIFEEGTTGKDHYFWPKALLTARKDAPASREHQQRGLATSDELALPSSDLRYSRQTLSTPTSSRQPQLTLDNTRNCSSTTGDIITPSTSVEVVEPLHSEGPKKSYGDLKDIDIHESGGFSKSRPAPDLMRRQSILPQQQTKLFQTLLETETLPSSKTRNHGAPPTISANMVSRKIWVKRPNASATLVSINEDDLVDSVKDMILKKYANSLGKNFDAPDVTLRIWTREHNQERILGPEEPMSRTIDAYFPGGQTVEEALVIDVPMRRTPKASPHGGPAIYYAEDARPGEAGNDYFPPMPIPHMPSPHLPNNAPAPGVGGNPAHHQAHAMSVLTTGHVPRLPSPGSSRRYHRERPRNIRTHTSSPTIISAHAQTPNSIINGTLQHPRATRSRAHSDVSDQSAAPPAAPPLPSPPAQDSTQIQRVSTPPPRVSSPRPRNKLPKKTKKSDHPSLPAGLLNGGVPPINVLIVEDNIINLKLLEAFMKRLKVRWQTAMNGKEAVTKWRAGGFHLVLMDIQLPVMNGLEATREIRRLEKLNSIGVFSSSASSSAPETADEPGGDEPEGDDKLPSSVLFKSPVIIVALTASSLQSDRHEALAAGCNDFLTKVRTFLAYCLGWSRYTQLTLIIAGQFCLA